jgi:hypothetical protein
MKLRGAVTLLKGVNKRVIIIKNPESEIFEEAYFIVKNKSIFNQAKENDMVLEANRIIADYSKQQKIAVEKAGENKSVNNKTEKPDKIDKTDKFEKFSNGGKNEKKPPDLSGEELFEEADFFSHNNFTEPNFPKYSAGSANKFAYSEQRKPSGFKVVSSKKIRKFKLPPKSFFIGVGFMSAIIIVLRIIEFILSG